MPAGGRADIRWWRHRSAGSVANAASVTRWASSSPACLVLVGVAALAVLREVEPGLLRVRRDARANQHVDDLEDDDRTQAGPRQRQAHRLGLGDQLGVARILG